MEVKKFQEAILEINKIIGFEVSPDFLKLRAWILISFKDYEGTLKDVQTLLTLDPNYMMFHRQLHYNSVVSTLQPLVQ